MPTIMSDFVIFSCVVTYLTGIVIAVAQLLID